MSNRISNIHTSCEKCAFAKYDQITQTDCLLGLIDKYRKTSHIEILEAYNDDKEFFIVNNKKCAAYKTQEFFDERNILDKTEYAFKNFEIKYNAIIDARPYTPEQLSPIFEELKQASVSPEIITLITYEYKAPGDYFVALNKSELKTKWKIKNLKHQEHDFIAVAHEIINLGNEKCPFVLTVQNKDNLAKIVDKANQVVYEEFKRFAVITNKTKSNMMFNKFVYQAGLQKNHDIITHEEEFMYI